MGLRIYKEPELSNPDLIAAWPGIGNIGFIAVDTLRRALHAEPFAEIEPWHYFFPRGILVQAGELVDVSFPKCRFFYKRLENRDCVFFVGEEQPAGGNKAYEIAEMILDVASLFNCRRIYTAAAAVTAIHHSARPKVWVTPNSDELTSQIKQYPNTVFLSDVEGRSGEGTITGLNGLLLGVARRRGFKGACLMGEIPIYISQFLTPYPKASRSILEVLGRILDISPDLSRIDEMERDVEQQIENLYTLIPQEVRDRMEHLKEVDQSAGTETDAITEEEKRDIMQNIEDLFKRGGQEN